MLAMLSSGFYNGRNVFRKDSKIRCKEDVSNTKNLLPLEMEYVQKDLHCFFGTNNSTEIEEEQSSMFMSIHLVINMYIYKISNDKTLKEI